MRRAPRLLLNRRRFFQGCAAGILLAPPASALAGGSSTSEAASRSIVPGPRKPDEQPSAVDALRPLLGVYVYAGQPDEDDQRIEAIEDVIDHVPLFFRGLARRKLLQATRIPERVALACDGRDLTVTVHKPFTAPIDGRPVPVDSITGHAMELHYEVEPNDVSQVFVGDERGQINRFFTDEDTLYCYVHVYAEHLPIQVEYMLTFDRLPSV